MSDLPARLRRWTHAVDAAPASDLMDEAAAEIERLRWRVMTLESAARYAAGRAEKETTMGHMKDIDRRIRQGGDDAIAAVGELLPQWISVEERLPGDETVLLAEAGGAWVTIGHISGDGWYIMECAEANGYREFSQYPFWLPLPEPPEVTK